MRTSKLIRMAAVLSMAVIIPSCHRDTPTPAPAPAPPPPPVIAPDTESEPNNGPATATLLTFGGTGKGSIATAGDIDYWAFNATANTDIEIELFAVRHDQGTWDANANSPRIILETWDGVTETPLLTHAFSASGWAFLRQDQDIPLFRVTTTGIYYLRVEGDNPANAGGGYAFRVTSIPLGTVQAEVESNDTAATATFITPGVVHATHGTATDLDYFSFSAPANSLVTFEVISYRAGIYGSSASYWAPPNVRLIATNGASTLLSDVDCYYRDPALTYVITTAATSAPFYTVRVGATGAIADYYLKFTLINVTGAMVEAEPNQPAPFSFNGSLAYGGAALATMDGNTDTDADFFSFNGTAGDMVSVRIYDRQCYQASSGTRYILASLYGSDGLTLSPFALSSSGLAGQSLTVGIQQLRAILPSTGTYFIKCVGTGSGTVPFTYMIALDRLKSGGFETEPNDTMPNLLAPNGRMGGVISRVGDVDRYEFTAAQSEFVVFSCYAQLRTGTGFDLSGGFGSTLQPRIRILDSDGVTELARSSYQPALGNSYAEGVSNGLATIEVSFVAPLAGTFFVEVSDQAGAASSSAIYLIEKR